MTFNAFAAEMVSFPLLLGLDSSFPVVQVFAILTIGLLVAIKLANELCDTVTNYYWKNHACIELFQMCTESKITATFDDLFRYMNNKSIRKHKMTQTNVRMMGHS